MNNDPIDRSNPRKCRIAHNALAIEILRNRASKIGIMGLTIYPDTVEKHGSGYFYVMTKCSYCGAQRQKELRNLEKGFSSKCQCQAKGRATAEYPGVDQKIITSLRTRFSCMKQRCEKDTHVSAHNYKGRGIKVLFKSRRDFVSWALETWPGETFEGKDFDRIDNDGNYSRENLRLVTRSENLFNRRNTLGSIRARAEKFQSRHPQVSYSFRTIWNLIQQGLSDAQILERFQQRKY